MSFDENAQLQYIRKTYGVPAFLNSIVNVNGRVGTIMGSIGPHIMVRFEPRLGEDYSNPLPCHPTWEVKYLDKSGAVIWPESDVSSRLAQSQRTAVKP